MPGWNKGVVRLFQPGVFIIKPQKHQGKTEEQKNAGEPYGTTSKGREQISSKSGSQGKQKNNTQIGQCLRTRLRIADPAPVTERFHSAADIANAHGTCKCTAISLLKCLNLHGTRKRNHRICRKIQCIRQDARHQQKNYSISKTVCRRTGIKMRRISGYSEKRCVCFMRRRRRYGDCWSLHV